MEGLLIILGGIAAIAGLLLYNAFSWGYVLYKFWYWFIIPAFTGVPHLTFYMCVGLFLCTAFFKNHEANPAYKMGDVKLKAEPNWGVALAAPWLMLVVGWFIKLWL